MHYTSSYYAAQAHLADLCQTSAGPPRLPGHGERPRLPPTSHLAAATAAELTPAAG